MFSILKKFWGDTQQHREELREQLQVEERIFEMQLEMEKEEKVNSNSNMNEIMGVTENEERTKQNVMMDGNGNPRDGTCFRSKGIITSLINDHGIIDNYIKFEAETSNDFAQLGVGYKVEYLATRYGDKVKVIKIENIIEHNWSETTVEKHINDQIKELKKEELTFFNVEQRNLLGLIKSRLSDSIVVETEYKTMNVDLETIEIDFLSKTGDRVNLLCNVQLDDSFVDKQGEILTVVKVEPLRKQVGEKCKVERVYEDFAVLNEDIYVLFSDLPTGLKLHIGDIVKADLIECEVGDYIWRCINLVVLEKTFGLLKTTDTSRTSKSSENQAITVSGDERCILVGMGTVKTINVNMKNNCNQAFKVFGIEFDKRRDTQLTMSSSCATGFLIEAFGEINLKIEVESKFFGESTEYFAIRLPKFRIRKSITVVVVQTEQEAVEAERRLAATMMLPASSGRNIGQRSRHYANQVWSAKMEVVPGVCIATRRRFVAIRIGYHEVPDTLRSLYLTSNRKSDMKAQVEGLYPCLKEELMFCNYVYRFQLLIHLEEIEYFVNFRNYDRERAHFLRDGEFLSLTIENLAERRPSIVIGDIVRAINPWAVLGDGDLRSYEGIVHKVLFNRVLLKFNSSFQDKYNGEDFRLEFYFSRFGFRKQHHALQRVVKHLGETFLFPSRVYTRENLQCEVRLDEDDYSLHLFDSVIPWYNKMLNEVQKRAVYNILRGEAENMPYIIFGPPGTGKTVTLVETVLQLVRNLPGSRVLIGTPSNSSADLITHRIIESGVLQQGEFIRLVSQNQIEKDLIPASLMSYCATVDIGSDGTCQDNMLITESGLKLRCQMKYLGRHRVTISTCTTLGNFLQMSFPPNHFTHVLIDEAGQCTEPECIVPITMVSRKRGQVILAGDPHQLQAIVINRYSGEKGYSLSFLERILSRTPYKKDLLRFKATSGYDPRLITKLLYNYRALPSIMNVYNELFYDSELMAMVSEENSREATQLNNLQKTLMQRYDQRPKSHGALFFGVRSENKQEEDSPSWFNPGEAQMIFFMTVRLYRNHIKPEDIGILTPYVKQVKRLRDLFIAANIAMPKIGSVEEFQGQERDIILISTVRSTETHLDSDSRYSLGFVRCMKRMNVAISRARYLMIIFGNPHLLSLDECWRKLIKYCYDNNAYDGCDLPNLVSKGEEGEQEDMVDDIELILD